MPINMGAELGATMVGDDAAVTFGPFAVCRGNAFRVLVVGVDVPIVVTGPGVP